MFTHTLNVWKNKVRLNSLSWGVFWTLQEASFVRSSTSCSGSLKHLSLFFVPFVVSVSSFGSPQQYSCVLLWLGNMASRWEWQQRRSTECLTEVSAEVHGAEGSYDGGDGDYRNALQPHNSTHLPHKPKTRISWLLYPHPPRTAHTDWMCSGGGKIRSAWLTLHDCITL